VKAVVCAVGEYIPVSVSPLNLIGGFAAEPATNVTPVAKLAAPVTFNVPVKFVAPVTFNGP
jgi:hypothetical protein